MFIRKTRKIDRKSGRVYHSFQLIESVRTARGPRQQRGPEARLRTEPGMRRVTEQLRGIERREVRSEAIVLGLKRRPGRIGDERAETQENHERLNPPGIRA